VNLYAKPRRWVTGTVCLPFMWLAAGAGAQVDLPPPPPPPPAESEPLSLADIYDLNVVSASKLAQKASSAPATVYVFSDETIRLRGYQYLDELLESVPEIEIQKKSSTEFGNIYTLRGIAGNEKFLVLIDGIRAASVTGTPHAILENFPLAKAKRVEVILGPASALYGVDAFTGVVSIITKNPEDIHGVQASGSYGRFNTSGMNVLAGHQLSDTIGLVLEANRYRSDEPMMPSFYRNEYAWYYNRYTKDGSMLDGSGQETTKPILPYATPSAHDSLFGKFVMKDVELGFFYNKSSHSSSLGMLPQTHLHVKEALTAHVNQGIFLRHRLGDPNAKFSLESTLSMAQSELTPDSMFRNVYTDYTTGYKYSRGSVAKLEEQLTYRFGQSSSVVAGFSYEDMSSLPKTGDLPKKFDPSKSDASQGFYYPGTERDPIEQSFFNVTSENVGLFAQLQAQLVDSLQATLGSRFDHSSRYGNSANPRSGLVYSASDDTKVKLLYGEAFLAPSPYIAYQHFGAFVDTGSAYKGPFWHLPNPDLKPEKLRTLEGSVTWYASRNVNLSSDLYYTRVTDLIQNQTYLNTETFKGVPLQVAVKPQNVGVAHFYGGSVGSSVFHYTSFGRFSYNASYAYSNGDMNRTDVSWKTIPFSARHTVKAGVDYVQGRWSVSPKLLFRSASYHAWNDLVTHGTPDSNRPYAVVDLDARFSDMFHSRDYKADAFVKVSNLFDRRYKNISWGTSEAFSATAQDPLKFEVGLAMAL
jgi:outer membrane receptor protein involved in Fe transport